MTKFLIFPIGWLTSIILACAVRLDVILAPLVTFVVGASCYTVRSFIEKNTPTAEQVAKRASFAVITRQLVAYLAILIASILVTRTYYWITWNPIGEARDDGWTLDEIPPAVDEFPTVSNGAGVIAQARRTRAPFLFIDTPIPYYVFVHKSNEANGSRNLVFRYDSTDAGWDSPPRITWINDSLLKISVGNGDILQVTRQETQMSGIRIVYALGPSLQPPALRFWQRPFFSNS